MRKVIICSNIYNEAKQLPAWFDCFEKLSDGGILIVDSGSTDESVEYARSRGAIVVVNSTIREQGYGPARTELRELAKQHFPDSHWACYFDADENISEEEFHIFRWVKDYLELEYDVIAFPRIDWYDREKSKAANDYRYAPDWQARMTRLDSPIKYVRKLHEQVTGHKAIYCNLTTPKINHFHRDASVKSKRSEIGKLCAKLHMEDTEFGETYGKHPREDFYYQKFLEEGL